MPSEQRLHPASLLFDLAKAVKNFAVPAVLVIVGSSRSTGGPGGMFGGLPMGWEAWLLVLFVPAVLISIARYLSFRLSYNDNELVIRTGLVFRNQRNVPFSRIQNVDAVQNVVHRLLGVVEVRIETAGGKEEEARLSVLPLAAFDDIRQHVFGDRARAAAATSRGEAAAPEVARGELLVYMPIKEVVLAGFLENKGMVLIGAASGVLWEAGLLDRVMGSVFAGTESVGRGFFRDLLRAIFDGGPMPLARIGIALGLVAGFLVVVRVISMVWAFLRLYDFRLTRVGEDLRREYGLLTRVAATVPIRRVQAVTVRAGPIYRLLDRATVKVATAGGTGDKSGVNVDDWLAPLIHRNALPDLLRQVVPGFDFDAVTWHPVHPRAFARAMKPGLLITAVVTLAAAFLISWGAIGVLILMLLWFVIVTRQHVAHLGWAEGEEVVMMKSGWIWQQTTIARINKIQAVTMHESPFDRRARMAGVRVDTAGAGEFSHRVDVPYLDRDIARALAARLSAAAAHTAFRW